MYWILGILGFFTFMAILESGVLGRFVKYVCNALKDGTEENNNEVL